MYFLTPKEASPAVEAQAESKEKISTRWNPKYDEYLKLRLDVPKGDEEKVRKALESSYGQLPDAEQAKENLRYLEDLLKNKFEDDPVYEVINAEKVKYQHQSEKLRNKGVDNPDRIAASEKFHSFVGHGYKTTRGFLEYRVDSLKYHINERNKTEQVKESDTNQMEAIRDKIKKLSNTQESGAIAVSPKDKNGV